MTTRKPSEARIRTRMARTGESYATARAGLSGARTSPKPVTDAGWALRGGLHAETSNVTNVLTHLGGDATGAHLSEAMLLGVGGGLGAGYMLWEIKGQTPNLFLGFRYRWTFHDWAERTMDRLGVGYQVKTTGSSKAAATTLHEQLTDGNPVLIAPDRQLVGYWHLPAEPALAGRGRPVFAGARRSPLVAYALTDDGIRVDDRNLAPLSVDADLLAEARARVSSTKNRMIVVHTVPETYALADAVRAGIADCVAHLDAKAATVALPAWSKWSRLVTDERNAKGWPTLYGKAGMATTLLSVWEHVEPAGLTGGNLRDLYADFLDEAAPLLGDSADAAADAAQLFRQSARLWHEIAETALPWDVPEYARLRELVATISAGVAAGDPAVADRAEAADTLWDLIAEYDRKPPAEPDLPRLSEQIQAVYDTEREAVGALRHVVG
ncbi:DUF4872 domain-containing protein [Micromonospora sp. WMMD710]|uniref:DUF4872 domain-containing protein n=1 Tax=Micromonospora sp. WMMD710 TaxID=3016085 RepID=UPI0024166107|nr:DUF4872 domain-containing protein [Micromonospora sp. WMMD710]MDG4758534.1 DUF4872 domain-containing protein [Micromonospora sp. WMMD710]